MAVHNKCYKSSSARNQAQGRVGSGGRCGQTISSIRKIPHQKEDLLRVALLNVGTMRCKSNEVVEILSIRGVDLCCVQEACWRGASAWMIVILGR